MLILEVVLTLCLSGIIYLEGEVSSHIAMIIGNRLYEESLTELTKKRIAWFANEYSVKIADRFNHVILYFYLGLWGNFHRSPRTFGYLQEHYHLRRDHRVHHNQPKEHSHYHDFPDRHLLFSLQNHQISLKESRQVLLRLQVFLRQSAWGKCQRSWNV